MTTPPTSLAARRGDSCGGVRPRLGSCGSGYSDDVIEVCEPSVGLASRVVIGYQEGDVPEGLARCVELAIDLGERNLVIDLGDRETASASLLGVLRAAARRLQDLGGSFGVVCARPGLRRLLWATCLSLSLSVYETREEALRG